MFKIIRFLSTKFIEKTAIIKREGSGVAIIVPLSLSNYLSNDEIISLKHLNDHLGRHSIYFIAPEGCTISPGRHTMMFFQKRYFGSTISHGKLLRSIRFYMLFKKFKYIFFYHLDSLVFSSDLDRWCDRDFDYIGSPWLQCADSPWVAHARIGNGGFALLKIQSAVKILSKYYQHKQHVYWIEYIIASKITSILCEFMRIFPGMNQTMTARFWKFMNTLDDQLLNQNNDIFWSDVATRLDPSFHVASFEDGVAFAFEACPEDCFVMNNYQIPFGCHAWNKYNKIFWDYYILK